MRRILLLLAATTACSSSSMQSPAAGAPAAAAANTPYKVLKSARVGGEGGTDYIHADPVGRRIYITRNAVRAVAATATAPAVVAVPGRVSVFDIETLAPLGEVINGGGNGAVVDYKSGHGFASSQPISMFDVKTLQMMKTIDPNEGNPPPAQQFQKDGIYFDPYNQRVWIGSHPTKDALVLDSKTGASLGKVPLGGVPEQTVGDGKGTIYFVLQDPIGSVAVIDANTMKVTKHFPFPNIGRCNGLAIDVKNSILFAACGATGDPPVQPAQPKMVVLSAIDGKILATLPLAGSSDGASFNPATMEAFSTHGNGTMTVVKEFSPTRFEVTQNLDTMNGARTIAFDPKTGHIFVMSVERGPAPPAPAGGGRGGAAPVIPGSFTVLMIGR